MIQDRDWTTLYRIGGTAALVAGVLFRRNISAEVSLFTGVEAIPQSVDAWFALLQSSPLLGLTLLAVFDLVNYALVSLVFLALCAALWSTHRSMVALALAGGLVGVTIGLASNVSLSMLSLSQQYAAATSGAQRAALLAAGQAVLAPHDPLAVYPGTGAYVSLLLIALAGLLFSTAMLRSNRATAIVGLLAGGCDLAYCVTLPFAPALRTLWLASGGLFWMIWHLLLAWKLLRLSKEGL